MSSNKPAESEGADVSAIPRHNPFLSPTQAWILSNVTIGIAGAGGLGSNCAMHLVRSGVRKLVIADFDIVSESNLNRQFYFADQIGQRKTDALGVNLRRIVPDLRLELLPERITPENAVPVFRNCSIVVEAFDTAAAKAMLLTALGGSRRPLVCASGLGGIGQSEKIRVNRFGRSVYVIGDGTANVTPGSGIFPFSPRVGIAAAAEANTVLALLLGEPI